MDAATVVAIVFGCLTITALLIGSAWTVAGKLGGLTVAVTTNIAKTDETNTLVKAHSEECDKDRSDFAVRQGKLEIANKAIGHTVDDVRQRLSNLES